MDELLSAVLDAHGGLDNWQSVRTLRVRFSRGGPFWGQWRSALRQASWKASSARSRSRK